MLHSKIIINALIKQDGSLRIHQVKLEMQNQELREAQRILQQYK